MMRYWFTISHVPGTSLKVADALSRAPCSGSSKSDSLLQEETAAYVDLVLQSLPASNRQLEQIKSHQERETKSAKRRSDILREAGHRDNHYVEL